MHGVDEERTGEVMHDVEQHGANTHKPNYIQTQKKTATTNAINTTQAFHPTPVFCAITIILFTVPLNFLLVPSN